MVYIMVRKMAKETALLSKDDRVLLTRVHSLLEELLETIEITEDAETMKGVREAEKDVEEGRLRDYQAFRKELTDAGGIEAFGLGMLLKELFGGMSD